jgi:hypothetical protein
MTQTPLLQLLMSLTHPSATHAVPAGSSVAIRFQVNNLGWFSYY